MRLAILPRASPSNLKGTCKPSPGATAGIWVLSRALTPRTARKDEDTSGELRNTASSRLLRQKSTCSCQNHEREWTLTWVTSVNRLSICSPPTEQQACTSCSSLSLATGLTVTTRGQQKPAMVAQGTSVCQEIK